MEDTPRTKAVNSSQLTLELQGQFLAAMPALQGTYFEQTLILICEHNDDVALGLVVNKPSPAKLQELLVELQLTPPAQLSTQEIDVYDGGPVSRERGFILHTGKYSQQSSLEVRPGLFLAGARETLEGVIAAAREDEFIFVLGYAGWEAGQLEAEIRENSWLTCAASAEVIFDRPPAARLQAAIDQLGFDYRLLTTEAGHG